MEKFLKVPLVTTKTIFLNYNFSDGSEPATWDQVTIARDDVNHKLANLEPKKTYAIRVQAVSDRGPGVISAPQVIKTLPLGMIFCLKNV